MRNTLQACAMLSLVGLIASPAIATAQLKPALDPQLTPYAKSSDASGTLTVVGSDSMKGLLLGWEGKLEDLYPNLKIQVQATGSETAPPALLEGKAQVAAMSRRMTPLEIDAFSKRFGYEPTEVPVALDALAVFVHRDNPIAGITLQELAAMFCTESEDGKAARLTSWSHFAPSEEWNRASIDLIGRNGTSGTAVLFRERVCPNREFAKTMQVEPGSASVVMGIKTNRYAVGFSGIGYRISSIKPIPLAASKGKPFVEPTFENVIDGTYPLHRRLYLYVNRAPKSGAPPTVAEFVKLAVSQYGQSVVVKEGFFPLPTTELNQLFAAWGKPVQAAGVPHAIPARD